jgi:hypothetical protein
VQDKLFKLMGCIPAKAQTPTNQSKRTIFDTEDVRNSTNNSSEI